MMMSSVICNHSENLSPDLRSWPAPAHQLLPRVCSQACVEEQAQGPENLPLSSVASSSFFH